MKDAEIRGRILEYYYAHRREAWSLPKPNDLGIDITEKDVLQVANQLAEHGLLEWRSLGSHGLISFGMGKINAFGIDVVEGSARTDLKVEFVQNKTINISGSTNVVIGDNNAVSQSVHNLVKAIEATQGTPEEKAEAKSLLKRFLEHPIVSAVAGGAIGLLG